MQHLKEWLRFGLAATTATAAAVALQASPASAAPILNIQYDASGEAQIASTGSTIELGPSTLSTALDYATFDFTGSMPLPGTETEFNLIGFLPVTADVAFQEVAPIAGSLSAAPVESRVDAVASYYIRLSNIRVLGFPTFAGPHCRTSDPVTIPIASPPSGEFNLFNGGHLSGEFTIGNFQNCGLNTWLINSVIPGSGNQVELDISNGRVAP
ncbi:hypothetical protein ACLM5J_13305 [Nocardioides sp. Bht2]|uniref:hypothetical protein n=1 Tax=Nocardioides sp. Bht2 TaxID=3392297 RepID=UPI0039B52F32